ncbi:MULTISPECIES: hypothetical protein [unclassified Enterococcus]|uniref:hypothetical protein n=1 Tax=unclassified Enterococcus TaxID=2608891 RepID=UPI001A9B7BD8|nr:hypothetical protein [Enterococcus sp. DIV1271a]MBO1298792.1 hypothetical protein [Enterococcus sp. DIV1271a]
MFEQLNKNGTLTQTLTWLEEKELTDYEELVFFPSSKHFKASILRTIDYTSLNEEDLAKLLSSFHLVARTIDGDYVLANDDTVYLLPRSHQKEEIQQFNGSLADLLIRYANSSKSIVDFFDFPAN